MSIFDTLRKTERLLSESNIPSARLDTEVLLAHALNVDRAWLHAHSSDNLQEKSLNHYKHIVSRRLQREPVAYITEKKEFYGREFAVTPDVLIPRPETEELIELTLKTTGNNPEKVLDVGCGSGCIGITLKLERPDWDITLVDISPQALTVAKENAQKLGTDVQFIESDLLLHYFDQPAPPSLIIANLPYVDSSWETSPETSYEPQLALYAAHNGLELIKKLLEQSSQLLTTGGQVLLEADPEQHSQIITHAATFGFVHQKTRGYAISLALPASH